jgi:hypothetical protein
MMHPNQHSTTNRSPPSYNASSFEPRIPSLEARIKAKLDEILPQARESIILFSALVAGGYHHKTDVVYYALNTHAESSPCSHVAPGTSEHHCDDMLTSIPTALPLSASWWLGTRLAKSAQRHRCCAVGECFLAVSSNLEYDLPHNVAVRCHVTHSVAFIGFLPVGSMLVGCFPTRNTCPVSSFLCRPEATGCLIQDPRFKNEGCTRYIRLVRAKQLTGKKSCERLAMYVRIHGCLACGGWPWTPNPASSSSSSSPK